MFIKDYEFYEIDSCETVNKNIDCVSLSSLDWCEDPPAQESSSSESKLYFHGFSDIVSLLLDYILLSWQHIFTNLF